uniref:Transducin/WD40 repeat-like superfamily protein n=1 Tax=Zea mays TaxID=4577 RepID=A0A804MYA9_MAIZE
MSETESAAAAPVAAAESKPRRLRGHKKGAVTCCVASSARPGVVASSGEDGCLCWFDLRTKDALLTMEAANKPISSICFKPGNEDFVYISAGNEILSFDVRMGTQSKPLETYNYNRDEINQIAVSSKGFLAAADDSGDVKIVNTIQKCLYKRLREAHTSICSSVQFIPWRPWTAITGGLDSKLAAWDFSKGRTLFSIDYGSPELQNGSSSGSAGQCFNPAFVHSVAVSEEGILGGLYKVCAVARGDGAVDVVDLEYELAPAKSKGPPRAAILTTRSKGAELGDGSCNQSRAKRIHLDYTMGGHTAAVSCVAFSAFGEKGKFLISGGNDASVKLWDWSKGFYSETNSKVDLVLDIDVKKKVCIVFHLHVVRKWIEEGLRTVSIGRQEPGGFAAVLWRRREMGGLLLPHHRTFPNSLQASIPGPLSLHKGDRKNLHYFAPDVHLFCSLRQGFPRSSWSAVIRSEASGNAVASPGTVIKRSKEELITFFRDIQTSIAECSRKASKRTRKQPPDLFQEVRRREEQSHGGGDSGTDDVSEGPRKVKSLEDMNVAGLRELARARRMRGYSKLKKGELIDRLRGATT